VIDLIDRTKIDEAIKEISEAKAQNREPEVSLLGTLLESIALHVERRIDEKIAEALNIRNKEIKDLRGDRDDARKEIAWLRAKEDKGISSPNGGTGG